MCVGVYHCDGGTFQHASHNWYLKTRVQEVMEVSHRAEFRDIPLTKQYTSFICSKSQKVIQWGQTLLEFQAHFQLWKDNAKENKKSCPVFFPLTKQYTFICSKSQKGIKWGQFCFKFHAPFSALKRKRGKHVWYLFLIYQPTKTLQVCFKGTAKRALILV